MLNIFMLCGRPSSTLNHTIGISFLFPQVQVLLAGFDCCGAVIFGVFPGGEELSVPPLQVGVRRVLFGCFFVGVAVCVFLAGLSVSGGDADGAAFVWAVPV